MGEDILDFALIPKDECDISTTAGDDHYYLEFGLTKMSG